MAIVKLAESAIEKALGDGKPKAVASKATSRSGKDQGVSVATQPALPYIVFGLAAFVIGYLGGLLLLGHFHPGMSKLPVIPAGVGVFSLFYVVAQAIERILQPVSWFGGGFLGGLGGRTKTELAKKHQVAVLDALNAPHEQQEAKAQEVANVQHDVDQYRANLTATSFGLAALLAMLVSGYVGLFMLSAVGLHIAGWLDLLVTGVAIAGGTKPLHDAISSLSSTSKSKGKPGATSL